MHKLLLGTAKPMVELWKVSGIVQSKDLEEIQAQVHGFISPNDISSMPSKISSSFFWIYS